MEARWVKTNSRSRKWNYVEDQSRFEAQLDPGFVGEFAGIPGGERLRECIQCGTCTGACPVSAYMDYTPRRLIAMTRAGVREDVLRSRSPWVCTSCYACTVACPKQVPITDIMHTLREISLKEGTYPKRFTTPVMTGAFVQTIERYGRSTESWISLKLYLKTDWMQLVKNLPVGRRLFFAGRLGLGHEKIRDQAGLKRMLETARKPSRVAAPRIGGTRVPVPVRASPVSEVTV